MLIDEGLPRSIVDLRIFACYSAVAPPGGGLAYAQTVKNTLRAERYRDVSVAGYDGEVNALHSARHGADHRGHKGAMDYNHPLQLNYRAKDRRHFF
jgi:hypothetical protein